MPKFVQILQSATPALENVIPILAEAEAIETIVVQLEPGAKTLLESEWTKIKAAASTTLTAAASFKSASYFGKATQAFSLLNAVLSIGGTLQGIYADGEKYFAAQWPEVKIHIENILGMVTAPTLPAMPATPATPVAPAQPAA